MATTWTAFQPSLGMKASPKKFGKELSAMGGIARCSVRFYFSPTATAVPWPLLLLGHYRPMFSILAIFDSCDYHLGMSTSIVVQGSSALAKERPVAPGSQLRIEVDGNPQKLPENLERLLLQALADYAAGQTLTFTSDSALVTTQQAADFIGVSRPTLIKLLVEHQTPLLTTGKHRRIRFSDLLVLEDQLRDQREVAFKELIEVSQSAGLYGLTDDGSNPLVKG